jgi:putative transposase
MLKHAHALRTGRYSESGRIYLLTTVTAHRTPLFADFGVARAVVHALRRSDETGRCRTLAYVLMPDHLHWLVELAEGDLSGLVGRFKANAAAAVNRELGVAKVHRWQRGFHDHAVRKEDDLVGLARYLVANPLRAGLVQRIGEYPHWDAVWL